MSNPYLFPRGDSDYELNDDSNIISDSGSSLSMTKPSLFPDPITSRLLLENVFHVPNALSQDWSDFLERSIMRGRNTLPSILPPSIARTSVDWPLWVIGVKIGFEELAAYQAHEILVYNNQLEGSIRAVIGRSSNPGCIVVEAINICSVKALANRLSHVIINKIYPVPPERYGSCLTEINSFTPISPGWIRLNFSIYKGDLAFVQSINPRTLSLCVILIPRIDYSSMRKKSSRPPKALFDLDAVKLRFGNNSVKIGIDRVEFNGNSYHDRFLILETHGYIPCNAAPTMEEIQLFHTCRAIPRTWMNITITSITANTLHHGDKVKVQGGQLHGHIGIVNSIVGENVIVSSEDLPTGLEVNLYHVRKHFEIGDSVVVCLGHHHGFTGWLVRIDGNNGYVFDNVLFEEITVFLRSLDFWTPPIYDSEKKSSSEISSRAHHSFTNRLVGCHVRVIGNNVFKNYIGIIKDVGKDGIASVELEATMRRSQICVKQLAFTDDPSMVPLAQPHVYRNNTLGHIPSYIKYDNHLQPSTPLPSQLTGFVSPAWDPSSRTPNMDNVSWIYSTSLHGKRIRVTLKGTKPVLRDSGFHYGDYEGHAGLFTGIDIRNNASITISVHKTLSVPSKYVYPMVPDLKGHRVIAIKGDLVGLEYTIVSITYPSCIIKPKISRSRKEFQDYYVDNLAILA